MTIIRKGPNRTETHYAGKCFKCGCIYSVEYYECVGTTIGFMGSLGYGRAHCPICQKVNNLNEELKK